MSGEAMLIEDAAEEARKNPRKWGKPASVELQDADRATFMALHGSRCRLKFGVMQLEDCYDEVYPLASNKHFSECVRDRGHNYYDIDGISTAQLWQKIMS